MDDERVGLGAALGLEDERSAARQRAATRASLLCRATQRLQAKDRRATATVPSSSSGPGRPRDSVRVGLILC